MIDRVQRTLEWMAPELTSYKIRKIFTNSQIEKIVENRKRYENKLQRPAKKVIDFIAYAHSEIKLEKIRNKKIVELGTGMEETDMLLQNNILRIYENAIYLFNEPIIFKEFSEYCIKKKATEKMKIVFGRKCLKNLKDTDLWIYCAQQLWEIEDGDGARSLFMKATAVNNDPKLYLEFFRFECLFSHKLNEINQELDVQEDEQDDIEKGAIALVVLQTILEKFGDAYKKEVLEVSEIYKNLHSKVCELFEVRRNQRISNNI